MKLLTAKDVASMLGISSVTVMRLANEGALPVIAVASRHRKRILRFRLEAVEQFVRRREQRPVNQTGHGERKKNDQKPTTLPGT